MTPQRIHLGRGRHPVVIADAFTGDADAIGVTADALAPFPPATNYYPGLRRVIAPGEGDAWRYVERLLEAAAPLIGGGFDVDSFQLAEASFSIVTADAAALRPEQRAPHFDSTDPNYLALLHYLRVPPGTGTAFFRQRSTGIEAVDTASAATFIATARAEDDPAAAPAYIAGSDARFEEIGRVEGVADRIVIYRGCLLHSGIIPPDLDRSGDPRRGRLTANLFLQAR